MAGNVNHEYHILEPDIWPLIGSISALTFTSGMVLYMHEMASGHLVLGLGIANCRKVTSEGCQVLGGCEPLRHLDLSGTAVADLTPPPYSRQPAV